MCLCSIPTASVAFLFRYYRSGLIAVSLNRTFISKKTTFSVSIWERECHYCGTSLEEEGLSTRCNYCRERVCGDHRLPEKHDCPGLYYQKQSTDSTRKSSSRRPSRSRTPPKPTFEQSKKTGQSRPSRTQRGSGSSRAPGKTPKKRV
ncbi:AN1-type zinc finger domain-containing protein [Halogeometricum salsisoli]|uniref:AN1-type zinc finger domain-containing protein n=1 Tax=Halogeometricum salsisoli TaxID=2950536 RepID=UPI003CCE2942